jgi:MoxR-like ATPase
VGERALVERAVVTLAGQRGLLLVGEPGTAKSMLSELLAAAISGSSGLTVQGTAGTTEDQLRYGWNYAALLAQGPGEQALVPSPIFQAMRRGAIARVEEITRCLPEVQDALVSILSDRRLAVPELGEEGVVHARPGFNVIATANLRDRGVSEMSAALKRRFNFENVPPIAALEQEVALVSAQVRSAIARVSPELPVDLAVLQALVTSFRDLRSGRTEEGWAVERPASVLSTAEAVAAGTSLCLQAAWFTERGAAAGLLPEHLLGVVLKDEPKDRARLVSYFDGPVKRRAEKDPLWREVFGARRVLDAP